MALPEQPSSPTQTSAREKVTTLVCKEELQEEVEQVNTGAALLESVNDKKKTSCSMLLDW